MNKDVTVILNGFKRPAVLKEQMEALEKQTVAPKNIFYWQNTMAGIPYDMTSINKCVSALSNANFGVWSRFAYALNARTNWVCIFDDDTIPGDQWLENCLDTVDKFPGLLGTIGVIFKGDGTYSVDHRVGWDRPNKETTQVDIVGHAWFFHRDLLSMFWRELPPIDHNFLVGEDIHFSHMIQKYSTFCKTLVPPHPKDNRRMWGSLKGWELGNDMNALGGFAIPLMNEYLQKACESGFRLLKQNA